MEAGYTDGPTAQRAAGAQSNWDKGQVARAGMHELFLDAYHDAR